jgi:hypothetical protein
VRTQQTSETFSWFMIIRLILHRLLVIMLTALLLKTSYSYRLGTSTAFVRRVQSNKLVHRGVSQQKVTAKGSSKKDADGEGKGVGSVITPRATDYSAW